MSEWQPIETAPHNQRILLIDKYTDEVFIGIKTGNSFSGCTIGVECSGGWEGCTINGERFDHVTHWMSLPQPPKDSND